MEKYENNDLFLNKYRISSIRLSNWDYASPGYYFVTICINDRKSHFGKIKNNKMQLSPIGKIVKNYWQQIPEHFKHINLDAFIIMPNHLHGIIHILWNDNPLFAKNENDNKKLYQNMVDNLCKNNFLCRDVVRFRRDAIQNLRRDEACLVSTQNTQTQNKNEFFSKISPQPGSLSVIIGSFKSACTKTIRKNHDLCFQWQPRFYDHIIRNKYALYRIRDYIYDNPSKWQRDRNNRIDLWM